ncbi:MAG: COX15/CtaA family protein [bacterium]
MKTYNKVARITLVLTYLVIFAGAFVRMTGSGMGCPDWPKCFGYYIPPTEISELEFQPDREYQKGQVIILKESLLVAKEDFKSASELDTTNWEAYTKHDYAIFNPWHTWIEYINRLLGALAGLATLILLAFSIKLWREDKVITLLSVFTVLAIGFQAWLGKTVVDSNLAPLKITIHMVMALVIVCVLLYLINKTRSTKPRTNKPSKKFKIILLITLVLTLVQIIMGTEVRQFVDEEIKRVGGTFDILADATRTPPTFYIHRSFSILLTLMYVYLGRLISKENLELSKFKWIYFLIGLEIFTGIAMTYFEFPFGTQTVHLMIASVLFGVHFYIILEAYKNKDDLQIQNNS